MIAYQRIFTGAIATRSVAVPDGRITGDIRVRRLAERLRLFRSAAPASRAVRRCSIGSTPSRTTFRMSAALSRASGLDTSAILPSPAECGLPFSL